VGDSTKELLFGAILEGIQDFSKPPVKVDILLLPRWPFMACYVPLNGDFRTCLLRLERIQQLPDRRVVARNSRGKLPVPTFLAVVGPAFSSHGGVMHIPYPGWKPRRSSCAVMSLSSDVIAFEVREDFVRFIRDVVCQVLVVLYAITHRHKCQCSDLSNFEAEFFVVDIPLLVAIALDALPDVFHQVKITAGYLNLGHLRSYGIDHCLLKVDVDGSGLTISTVQYHFQHCFISLLRLTRQ